MRTVGKNHLYHKVTAQQPVLESAAGEEILTKEEEEKWQEGWVKYEGEVYTYNEEILTFLIMGIDKQSDVEEVA